MSSTLAAHQQVASRLASETSAGGEGSALYAILDAARHSDVPYLLKWANVEHECLYMGESRENLWFVAPYLLKVETQSEFFTLLLEQGWGQSWGIFLTSASDLAQLHKHFRHFLLVKGEDDRDFYFRFYDPRVLRVYLPTCTAEEAREFFGPISSYLMEAERPDALLKFTAGERGARLESINLSATDDFEPTLQPATSQDG